jgi:hypothetical protein
VLTAPAAGAQVGTPPAAPRFDSAAPATPSPTSQGAGLIDGFGPWLPLVAILGAVGGVAYGARTRGRRRSAIDAYEVPPTSVIHVPKIYGGRPPEASAEVDIEVDVLAAEAETSEPEPDRTGERRLAAEFAALPEGEWWVVDDLPIGRGGANIDKLVIGAGGVFTITAKKSWWPVWIAERMALVAGRRTTYLQDAVADANAVRDRLARATDTAVPVFPVMVFVDTNLTVDATPPDVAVVHVDDLVDWLLTRPPLLTPDEARSIGIGIGASRAAIPD